MMPRFGNGVQLLVLLLLTFQNVSSKSHKKLKPADVVGSSRLEAKDDQDRNENKADVTQESVTSSPRDDNLSRESRYVKHLLSLGKSLKLVRPRAEEDRSNDGNFLARLLEMKNGPVAVFLTPGMDTNLNAVQSNDVTSEERDYKPDEDDESEEKAEKYVAPPGENDAYVLYNVLRTTQQDEDLDPKAQKAFEKTKEVLRQAFALRCGAKNACEEKCPEKKPKCPMNCEKEKRQVKKSCQRKCDAKPACAKKCVEKKVDECEEKVDECEEKQEKKCENKCQETFDELDACPKKKTCSKCGK